MAFEIIMPKLGVDMQEGEIIEWKKQEGDVVNEGDILLEIMSDKTNMELEAEDSGVLLKITRQAGETVPVTEVIGYIGAEGEVVADNVASAPAAEPAPKVEKVAAVAEPVVAAQTQAPAFTKVAKYVQHLRLERWRVSWGLTSLKFQELEQKVVFMQMTLRTLKVLNLRRLHWHVRSQRTLVLT